MKQFMNEDFLLNSETARQLFHDAAKDEPIFDYHCHLPPKDIAEDRRFDNLAALWLGEGNTGDHYKWRALRANGVDEKYITGNADPYERFLAWADTVPRLIGNPLYHWTHLELQRYFDIYEPLNRESAQAIWKQANDRLKNDPEFSVYGIFRKFKVALAGTTDDPVDSLEWHRQIAYSGKTETKTLPSFRPDKALNINADGYAVYIEKLGAASGINIRSSSDLLEALKNRIDFFDRMGCRSSDHGLEYVPFETASNGTAGSLWEKEADAAFTAALSGGKACKSEEDSFKTFALSFLAKEYAKRNWVMQLHIAPMRNNNTRMFRSIGADTGYDAIHDHPVAAPLSRFLDLLEQEEMLPKTILYSLNFKDLSTLASVMGCFQDGNGPGKMQLGSAWWFLDHRDGMEDQMKLLANTGLLSRFVGMLTDSRSFLSYPRHEYFRRILCNLLGSWAENGEIPNDSALLSSMVKDICFANARNYFFSGN
jgi:glucuronate isomerase